MFELMEGTYGKEKVFIKQIRGDIPNREKLTMVCGKCANTYVVFAYFDTLRGARDRWCSRNFTPGLLEAHNAQLLICL